MSSVVYEANSVLEIIKFFDGTVLLKLVWSRWATNILL